MSTFRFRVLLAVSILVLGAGAAAGVVAATQPSGDELALQPTREPADRRIESRVNDLLAKMTLEEKLQQIQLLPDFLVTDDGVRQGLGSILSVTDPARIRELQRMAVEESRLKIPILFAFDTIHGFRTVFPIPLAAGASFDPQVAFDDHTYGARESAAVGLKQTYAPMVDVSHEPRWGRISEGAGEDPYLNAVLAAARVKAIQGRDYSAPDKLVASPKHFAAYGQPEGGRDYGTTDMSVQRLWNFYLPPFKAAIDAGADTAMCSFNAINGVPGCGNDELMNEILKHDWGFDGFVESDWTAVSELRACPPKTPDAGECGHGVAADGPGSRSARAQLRRGLGDDEHADPRLRPAVARRTPDLDEADRRRRAQDPARQVPRRPVRAPVRTVHARPGRSADAAAGRRGGGAQGCGSVDGALEERRRHPAAQSVQEDGSDRAAREEPARPARALVGRRPRQRRRHRLRRHQRAEPAARPTPRAASSRTPSRRTPIPRVAARTPVSPQRSPRPTRRTRSCSPWARRAR